MGAYKMGGALKELEVRLKKDEIFEIKNDKEFFILAGQWFKRFLNIRYVDGKMTNASAGEAHHYKNLTTRKTEEDFKGYIKKIFKANINYFKKESFFDKSLAAILTYNLEGEYSNKGLGIELFTGSYLKSNNILENNKED